MCQNISFRIFHFSRWIKVGGQDLKKKVSRAYQSLILHPHYQCSQFPLWYICTFIPRNYVQVLFQKNVIPFQPYLVFFNLRTRLLSYSFSSSLFGMFDILTFLKNSETKPFSLLMNFFFTLRFLSLWNTLNHWFVFVVSSLNVLIGSLSLNLYTSINLVL